MAGDKTLQAGSPGDVMPGATPAQAVFDRNWILDQIGGDEALFKEVIEVFTADAPRLISNLQAAVASQSSQALFGAAHAAKSAVGNFGAQDAVAIANEIEQKAKRGDFSGAAALCPALTEAIQRLVEALRRDQIFSDNAA